MRYFRLPLNSDLSQTSYRDSKLIETNEYIEYNEGYIGEDWEEITEKTLAEVFRRNPFVEEQEPEPATEILTETESAIYDTQANVEYLVCLSELGL